MERILKILVISIFAFLLILWIATVFNTCNDKKADDNIQTEMVDDSIGGSDEVDLTEDIFEDDSTATTTDDQSVSDKATAKSNEEDINDYTDYSGEVKNEKAKVASTPAKTSKPKQKTQPASSKGRYLVVAGSYLVKGNAEKMKKRLYDLGYDSEIVNFNLSQYYSVLAGRYYSRKEAQNTVTILKRNGIDSYVHRKK